MSGNAGSRRLSLITLTNIGGVLYFNADDGVNGPELWRINRSGLAEMVEDKIPGGGIGPSSFGSNPSSMVNLGSKLLFAADDSASGRELWVFSPEPNSVTNRQVFYNRSPNAAFGSGSANPVPAIDSTKTPLLPGQTASFANYTNYVRGLNGLIVDFSDAVGAVGVSDFQFAAWDGMNALGFQPITAQPTITVIPDGGGLRQARVKIEFADHAIRNTWLQITILANAVTGLASNDVFYFGNAVGDMNANNFGSPILVQTNASDTAAVRQNQSINANSVSIESVYDLNKDGRVNASDTAAVRQNQNLRLIRYFTAPLNLTVSSYLGEDSRVLASPLVVVGSKEKGIQNETSDEAIAVSFSGRRPSSAVVDVLPAERLGRPLLDKSAATKSPDSSTSDSIRILDAFFAQLGSKAFSLQIRSLKR